MPAISSLTQVIANRSTKFSSRDLRHRIVVGKRTITGQDSYGNDTITYPTLGTFYALVEAIQGRELDAAMQRWAEARFKVRLHYNTYGIDRADRISWGTRTLDILDIEDPFGDQRWLVAVCKEFVE